MFPAQRRLWDRVHEHIILGSVPFRETDVSALVAAGVRGVVNMMREWDGNARLYKSLGIAYKYAPTVDFEEPSLEDALACAAFVKDAVAAGDTVYVHCREGKGRSLCVVIAYMMLYEGMTAEGAEALVRKARPHVAKKAHKPLFGALAAHKAAHLDVRSPRAEGLGY
jgi:atypical dual specificity phosphatase